MIMEPLMYNVSKKELTPVVGSAGAAGMDLRCNLNLRPDQECLLVRPNESTVFGTGVRVAIPGGWVGLVLPRSGMGFKYEVMLANTCGVIDSDYRGEIKIKLVNRGRKDLYLDNYDRVVQMVVVPHWEMEHIQQLSDKEFDELTTERGAQGFGSTGIK